MKNDKFLGFLYLRADAADCYSSIDMIIIITTITATVTVIMTIYNIIFSSNTCNIVSTCETMIIVIINFAVSAGALTFRNRKEWNSVTWRGRGRGCVSTLGDWYHGWHCTGAMTENAHKTVVATVYVIATSMISIIVISVVSSCMIMIIVIIFISI